MTKHLIVNADDLGISIPVNLAIRQGFREGIVTSASLLANMPAFDHAVEEVIRPNPGLGIGIHLCATSGPPVLSPERLPLLADVQWGCFCHGFLGLWRLLHSRRREETLGQIRQEWSAQIERAEALGLPIDHLDSHQHVHMIPGLFDIVVEVAQTREIAVRMSSEAFRLRGRGLMGALACVANGGLAKNALLSHFAVVNRRRRPNVPSTDHYFGILDTGRMTLARLRSILRSLPDGVSEITVHPVLPSPVSGEGSGVRACSPKDHRFVRRRHASEELAALLDPAVRETLGSQGIRLARFQDFPARSSAEPQCAATGGRPSISSTTTESTASGA